ncbi:MAG: MFS transporter [Tepidisphaeraceae bacterium]
MPEPSDALADLSPAARRQAMGRITMAWLFGAAWANALAGAPLTLFATKLGATEFEFGLLAAMPFMAALLSLPASLLTDRTGRRNFWFFLGLYPNRLLWIVVALLPPFLWSRYGSAPAVAAFLSLIFIINIGQAMGSPGWTSWMADIVPPMIRGRYFAKRRQWGIVSGIPAALIAGWVIDHYAFGDGDNVLRVCGAIFIVAALIGVLDIFTFQFVPHAVRKKPREPLMKTLSGPLKNRRFLWFCLGTAVLWFGVAAQGQFVTKFLTDRVGLHGMQVQAMTLVVPMVAQWLVLPLWGRTIDRFGKKPALLIATLGLVPVGAGWVFMGTEHIWLGYVLTTVGSVMWTGVDVSNFNMTMELSGTDPTGQSGGSAYLAMNSVILNSSACVGGFFFGAVAQNLAANALPVNALNGWTYFEVLFAISAVLRLVAVLPMLKIKEPEAQPTVDALRFMAGTLYNNVFGAVTLPGRLFFRKPSESEPT